MNLNFVVTLAISFSPDAEALRRKDFLALTLTESGCNFMSSIGSIQQAIA